MEYNTFNSQSQTDLKNKKGTLFLISRHLDMAYTAQQRDIDDPKVIQRFSEIIQDEERLKMLYLSKSVMPV